MIGPFQGIGKGAVAVHHLAGLFQILGTLIEGFQGALPEGLFLRRAAAEGKHHRQGDLAFAEIVAAFLAHRFRIGSVIQHIIGQLEGNAEIEAESGQRLFLQPGPSGHHRAEPGGSSEEGGRLGGDDIQVIGFRGCRIIGRGQLKNLALGDDGGGIGKDIENIEGAVLDHQLEGSREEKIAYQNARLVAPERVGGGAAAPEIGIIDHIIMKQGRGVDEFHRGRQPEMTVSAIAAKLRAAQKKHRAQPFSPCGDDMPRKLGNERHAAFHPLEDQAVDAAQIVSHQPLKRSKGGFGILPALVVKGDDDGQG